MIRWANITAAETNDTGVLPIDMKKKGPAILPLRMLLLQLLLLLRLPLQPLLLLFMLLLLLLTLLPLMLLL
jgi:hypothetical protein